MAKDKEVTTPQPRQTAPARLEDQMERLFEDFFGRRWLRPWQWPRGEGIEARMPPVDVVDREHEVLVRAELPGMAKEDIEVSVSGNTITVKGSTRKEEKRKTATSTGGKSSAARCPAPSLCPVRSRATRPALS